MEKRIWVSPIVEAEEEELLTEIQADLLIKNGIKPTRKDKSLEDFVQHHGRKIENIFRKEDGICQMEQQNLAGKKQKRLFTR